LLTLAGLEDPSKAPSFQSVVLDQIKHLRKQLEEDEQAAMLARGRWSENERGDVYGDEGMNEEDHQGRGARYLSQVVGNDGLRQMVIQGDRKEGSPLTVKV
jgi:hypothetical protein